MTKLFLKISEISDEYNINRKIIDDAIHNQKLQSYQFGNKTKYIKRKDLELWIETKKYGSKIPLIKYNSLRGG